MSLNLIAMKSLGTLAGCLVASTLMIHLPANAGSLIDGEYSGPEESFVVTNGRLLKCYIPGPNYGSCSNDMVTATQVGPNTIRVKSSWGMNALKCKGALPAGKDGFKAKCTAQGWQ